METRAAFAARICSRSDCEDFAAVAAFGEGPLSSFGAGGGAAFFTVGRGVTFAIGVRCASAPKRSATDPRVCCTRGAIVLLPLIGILPLTVFATTGVGGCSFSTDFSRLAFVGERARIVFAEFPFGNLVGVPRIEELRFGRLGFAPRALGVANGGGAMSPSLVVGRDPLPIDEAGLELGLIGLSGEKKLDLLLELCGDGGILARLSIVLSDNEGRDVFLKVGVRGVLPGDVAAVEHVFSLWKLLSDPRSSSCVVLALLLDVLACLGFAFAARFALDNGLPAGFLNVPSLL